MIIVDNALAEREAMGRPIRIGLVGAGFAGKGFALQVLSGLPGLRLVAISNVAGNNHSRAPGSTFVTVGPDIVSRRSLSMIVMRAR